MREKPIRAQIYLPNIKYFVEDRNWKWIGAVTLVPYIALFITDLFLFPIRLFYIPIYAFTTPLCLVGSILFFKWIHHGKLPGWFEHHVQAAMESNAHRGQLPGDQLHRKWLIDKEVQAANEVAVGYVYQPGELTPVERVILS